MKFLWRNEAHQLWAGETLYFWKIAVERSRDLTDVSRKIGEILLRNHCFSYKIYIVTGKHDLVIRSWIRSHQLFNQIKGDFYSEFQGCEVETLLVDEILSHWPWNENCTKKLAPNSMPIGSKIIHRVNCGSISDSEAQDSDLNNYFIEMPEKDVDEISFLIFARLAKSNTQNALEEIKTAIEACINSSGIKKYSIYYSGDGGGVVIIKATTFAHNFLEKFAKLHEEIIDSSLVNKDKFHTESYIALNSVLDIKDFRDELQIGLSNNGLKHEMDFLEADESQYLEIKASLSLDVSRYANTGVKERSETSEDEVLQAVCGMLNTPENGQVIIGLLERDHKDHSQWGEKLDLPNQGNCIVFGLEEGDFEVLTRSKKNANEDAFKLHFYNLLDGKISPSPREYVKLDFKKVLERTIAVVTVDSPDTKHVFIDDKKRQRYFVRRDNSTIEQNILEVLGSSDFC